MTGGATLTIIYYCFAGAHASVVAAAIHCGLLPNDHVPTHDEFLRLPYYDGGAPELVGTPYFMGETKAGHKIYFMGMWSQREKVSVTIKLLLTVAGVNESDYILQDAYPLVAFSTKVGGLLSKRLRLKGLGCKLSVWGIQRQYVGFIALVQMVKERLLDDTKTD